MTAATRTERVHNVSERAFQTSVLDLARLLNWRCYHTHDSRRSEPGFPDLVLTRRGRIVFAELKSETGRVTRAQREWLGALSACPAVEVYLWRPSDWNEIEELLRKRSESTRSLGGD